MTRKASSRPSAVAQAAWPAAAPWVLQAAAFAVAAMIVTLALLLPATSLPPSGAVLMATAIPTLLSPLFWSGGTDPQQDLRRSIRSWALVVLLLAGIAWLALGIRFALAPLGLAILVALGIVVVAHQSTRVLEAALQGIGIDASTALDRSTWIVTAVLWLAASAPLWLGPVADLSARQAPLAPTVVLACSPLAHLAVAAGNDVLRGEWFYGHSSLGSLQVDYPRIGTMLVAYLLLATALRLLLAYVRRRLPSNAGPVAPGSPGESAA